MTHYDDSRGSGVNGPFRTKREKGGAPRRIPTCALVAGRPCGGRGIFSFRYQGLRPGLNYVAPLGAGSTITMESFPPFRTERERVGHPKKEWGTLNAGAS